MSNVQYEGFKKLSLDEVINIIEAGWDYQIYYATSKSKPGNQFIWAQAFRNRTIFERWHKKNKQSLCNKTDGLTLKHYMKKGES